VHDLAQARAALAAAATAGSEIHLLTPPGGARYAGAPYFAEVFRQAAAVVPAARYRATLDCGDDAALALDAIAEGWRSLVLSGGRKAFAKIAAIAEARRAAVLQRRPPAVDLAAADPFAASLKILRDTRATLKGATR
jgi:fructose/tagatose bisphosphate aldolase